jgi:hypothetical protein
MTPQLTIPNTSIEYGLIVGRNPAQKRIDVDLVS